MGIVYRRYFSILIWNDIIKIKTNIFLNQIMACWRYYEKSYRYLINKGGVGKSTLCFHLACALNEMGKKVLLLDLDPQCNLTICGMKEEQLHAIWEEEEPFIDDYESAWKSDELVEKVLESPRSIHFLLKATEEGVND